MTLEFALEIAAKTLIPGALTLLALRLAARRSASDRSWIVHAGLLATVLLPMAALLAPAWRVAPDLTEAVTDAAAFPLPAPADVAAPAVGSVAEANATEGTIIGAGAILLACYALPAALLLIGTLVAVFRLSALRRRAAVLVDQAWLNAMAHAQRRMGIKHGTALLVSDEIRSPVSWGMLRPVIVLDEAAATAPGNAEAIIAHELAHVARHDWAKLLLARMATALFWFNPFVWMMARAGEQLREEAADDAVLRSAVDRTDYAALLVRAARHRSGGRMLAANGVAPTGSSLALRVRRVLDGTVERGSAPAGWIAACSLVVLGIVVPLAALTTIRGMPAMAEETLPAISIDIVNPPSQIPRSPDRAAEPASPPPPTSAAIAPVTAAPLPHPAPAAPLPIAPAPVAAAPVVQLTAPSVGRGNTVEGAQAGDETERLSPGQIFALRAQGVSSTWIAEMAALGYRRMDYGHLSALAAHGVTPKFIRAMAAAGYPRLSVDQLTAMRIYGVTADYARRVVQARSGSAPDVRRLIEMKIYGLGAEDDPDPWPDRGSESEVENEDH
jgi:beta-lactamase regulating signal transducer with metallopeptidase domain